MCWGENASDASLKSMTSSKADKDADRLREKAMARWGLINHLAKRRFSNEAVADEAALYVLDSLADQDWKRLRQFSGKSRFTTFFSSVTYRLLEDFSRMKYGRITPPKWIREAGGIWLMLFRLLCLERFSFHEAVLLAKERQPAIVTDLIEEAAESILGELPQCGKAQQEVEFREECVNTGNPDTAGQERVENRERRLLLFAVAREIYGESVDEDREHALVRLLGKPFDLQDDEKVLLKLCYQEGLSVTKAGKMLGMNRFQAHGKMRRLLTRIRQHFSDAGCEEELRLLLT